MPRQGGQGKGKPKMHDRDFGRALIRQQTQGAHGYLGTKTDLHRKNMTSILEINALDDFIDKVEMDEDDVEVNRYDNEDDRAPVVVMNSVAPKAQQISGDSFVQEQLTIPRKPEWNFSMSAEDVDRNEKRAFMEWRRKIAEFENNATYSQRITPFEKNLEVWRQLWRVCERSNVVIQVVDGRNPLLFYTGDLCNYLAAMNPPRQMILLVNKSDLLSAKQRTAWKDYFDANKTKHLFYSAYFEQLKLDNDEGEPVGSAGLDVDAIAQYLFAADLASPVTDGQVLTRHNLISVLTRFSEVCVRDVSKPFCVGMVGYPNVGKSSCINTLLGVTKSNHGKLRVAVSSTPGKTKHFQTIPLAASLMLCDCPGLVFPSFMRSAGEMLCSGVLPINQMRDCIDPADIICARVPRHILEATYGMRIARELDVLDNPHRPPTGTEMLAAYCKIKGYITGGTGRWDDFRGCKEILRDFNDGKLLYVAKPANNTSSLDEWLQETEATVMKLDKVAERAQRMRQEVKETLAEEVAALESAEGVSVEDIDVEQCYEEVVENEVTEVAGSTTEAKREHKKLKHWGKKNKKLRDKDPYGEDHGTADFIANVRNRAKIGAESQSHFRFVTK